jgi:nicotinamidase/pyrazinamidase
MSALIIVDMQNDFMPGGPLGVQGAEQLIPLINELSPHFSFVIATQDWHPSDHMSFAANHPGKKVGEWIDLKGVPQILWPVHCVKNTPGSEIVSGLNKKHFTCNFYKGTDQWIDSYSAFFDNARARSTGLGDYLTSRQIKELFICGVATDYCVLYTTLDALDLGFSVTVIEDACRGINLKSGDVERALIAMQEKGAHLITTKEFREGSCKSLLTP